MQLSRAARPWIFALTALASSAPGSSRADGEVGTTTTVYRDGQGGVEMTVVTPSVHAEGTIRDAVTISVGWEADVVSGASIAVVDAPGEVDAVTSATTLTDLRNTVRGGLTLHGDYASLSVGYTWGAESDYVSNGISVSARTELFERNTAFELGYSRGFDRVCTLAQPRNQEAVDRQRMPDSSGCFGGDDRTSLDLDLSTFQGTWTQAWAPVFVTQLIVTGQILHGYQGNPYRAVWLGRSAAQEHHPENRARYSAGLGARLYIPPLRGALQLFGRLYRDTWDVESVTAEVAWEQTLTQGLRLRARGRYYLQDAAAFFSDDYVLSPRGQYFTGDRELSGMSSWTIGGQLVFGVPPNEEGDVLGFLASLDVLGKFDYVLLSFDDFHYGSADVPNDQALMATLGIEAAF